MHMNETRRIAAPPAAVWAALNDPAILRAAIPGCDSLDLVSPTEMTARVTLRIGPVKASFAGKVTLSELDPPNGYRIDGEGSGGVAGFAKGGAVVRLEPDGTEATLLGYAVDAQVGGKLAQLGARLIDATARRLAGEFFENFARAVAPEAVETEPLPEPAPEPEPAEAAASVELEAAAAPAPAKTGWLKGLFGGKAAAAPAVLLALAGGGALQACCMAHAAEADMLLAAARLCGTGA